GAQADRGDSREIPDRPKLTHEQRTEPASGSGKTGRLAVPAPIASGRCSRGGRHLARSCPSRISAVRSLSGGKRTYAGRPGIAPTGSSNERSILLHRMSPKVAQPGRPGTSAQCPLLRAYPTLSGRGSTAAALADFGASVGRSSRKQ